MFPVMSPVHSRWFSSTVSSDKNMVTCIIASLETKISTGHAMSLIFYLRTASSPISLMSQSQHGPLSSSLILSHSSHFLQVALYSSNKICYLPSCLLIYLYLLIILIHFVPVIGQKWPLCCGRPPFVRFLTIFCCC